MKKIRHFFRKLLNRNNNVIHELKVRLMFMPTPYDGSLRHHYHVFSICYPACSFCRVSYPMMGGAPHVEVLKSFVFKGGRPGFMEEIKQTIDNYGISNAVFVADSADFGSIYVADLKDNGFEVLTPKLGLDCFMKSDKETYFNISAKMLADAYQAVNEYRIHFHSFIFSDGLIDLIPMAYTKTYAGNGKITYSVNTSPEETVVLAVWRSVCLIFAEGGGCDPSMPIHLRGVGLGDKNGASRINASS